MVTQLSDQVRDEDRRGDYVKQKYNYNEVCRLQTGTEEYLIVRSKFTTHPSGQQTWEYMLAKMDGMVYKEGDEVWIAEKRLRKSFDLSPYNFHQLMHVLKYDPIEKGDFE